MSREENKRNGKLFSKNFANKISPKIDERSSILTIRKKAQVQKTNQFLINLSELFFMTKFVSYFKVQAYVKYFIFCACQFLFLMVVVFPPFLDKLKRRGHN